MYNLDCLEMNGGGIMNWQIQVAKNKLSEVIDYALKEGPQVITKHGKKVAVMVSAVDYDQMKMKKCDLVAFFRNSPLVGNVKIERSKDSMIRKVKI